jgi:hypothetical protein
MSNLWFSLFNSFYTYFILKPNLVLYLLHFNFMYQRVFKIQLCMFEKKLQVKLVFLNIPSNKFVMLKIDSLNKEENIGSSKSSHIYIYIYIYIYM